LVICELLGVPYADHPFFQEHTSTAVRFDTPPADAATAMGALYGYLARLVEHRRRAPQQDDLLGGLIAAGDLDDEELTNIALILLAAGHETTANMIGLGMLALFEHPEQLAALRADPGLVDSAVEELLRYLTITPTGARMALEDVELGGQTVEAGDTVALSIQSANRDPLRYPEPDRLDSGRKTAGHVAFGHGIHQCLGQQLARVELQTAIPALVRRFPTLRLAVAPDDVPMRDGMPIYGVHRLPVTWDVP
ncbi:MAG: cytochrome P450, partial [Actinomycetes bacterium]